jgi:hypothetical protein
MVQTFPAVRRASSRFGLAMALTTFIASSALGGAGVGLALGYLGNALSVADRTALSFAAIAVAMAIDLRMLPRLQRARQVPSAWRDRMPPPVFVTLYGAMLGTGLLTYIPHSTFYIVLVGAATSGPLGGALIMIVYGLTRALPVLWSVRWPVELAARNGLLLASWDQSIRRLNRAAVLIVFGASCWSLLLTLIPTSR